MADPESVASEGEEREAALARDSAAALARRARALVNPEFRALLGGSSGQRAPAAPARSSRHATKGSRSQGQSESEGALRGVVVLVDVASEREAVALRATLRALGASVRPAWADDVTHVVWRGGCGLVRRRALRLNAHVVSPRWVLRCAAAARHEPEQGLRAPRVSRTHDPLSPQRMRQLLLWAEKENVPLEVSMSDSGSGSGSERERLRLRDSSGSDADAATALQHRVNTALRRALPTSPRSPPPPRPPPPPRRKLFTQREPHCKDSAADDSHSDDDGDGRTQGTTTTRQTPRVRLHHPKDMPVIVCTGVGSGVAAEARACTEAAGGRVEAHVSGRTTHVVCAERDGRPVRTLAALEGAARGCWAVSARWVRHSLAKRRWLPSHHYRLEPLCAAHAAARALRCAAGAAAGPVLLDVFGGVRVCVSRGARHGRRVARLLRLCGASVVPQSTASSASPTLLVTDRAEEAAAAAAAGAGQEAVSSRWVFDSVAKGRARATTRYRPLPLPSPRFPPQRNTLQSVTPSQ